MSNEYKILSKAHFSNAHSIHKYSVGIEVSERKATECSPRELRIGFVQTQGVINEVRSIPVRAEDLFDIGRHFIMIAESRMRQKGFDPTYYAYKSFDLDLREDKETKTP